jgi:hypothetical protein
MSELKQPDLSSRLLPILFAPMIGVVYIFACPILLRGNEHFLVFLWRCFPFAQFLYIVPIAIACHRRGKIKAFQGWLIGAAIAALLLAPCWGLAWFLK